MVWYVRKRPIFVFFCLTGVLLVFAILNLNKHPVLHRMPFKDINGNVQDRHIFFAQSHDGRSLKMNGISQEDMQFQEPEMTGEGQEKQGKGLEEETVSLRKEKNETSPESNSKRKELTAGKYGGSYLEERRSKRTENIPDGVVTANNIIITKPSLGKAYLADEELQDLRLKPQIRTNVMTLSRQSSTNDTIKKVLTLLSARIQKYFANEQLDINFTPGERIPVNRIRRVLIASTWRSGSSFLGEVVSAYPGTFYSFEPLHIYLKNQHLEAGEDVPKVIKHLKDVSTCNLIPHADYIEYMKNRTFLMLHNKIVWKSCAFNRKLCFNPHFLSQICQYLPLNVMKTVRLGLVPIEQLLEDPSLDMRVIYLIRDPRGSMHSRMKLKWCISKTCRDPQTVCDNLLTDIQLSEKYTEKYPDKFLLVRYEDLSLEPELVTKEILRIAGLSYHRNIEAFLKGHTKVSMKKSKRTKLLGPYSTFRDSQTAALAWRDELTFEQVDNIQRPCKDVLHRLGYTYLRTSEECHNKNISVFT